MALNEIVAKQLAALTPEQRQQIKQELIKNPSPANQDLISAIDESNATATGQPPMSMPVQQQAKPSILPPANVPVAVQPEAVQPNVVQPRSNRILNAGGNILSGIGNLAEGALLGLQGRPFSEHSMLQAKPVDKYEELLKAEQLKNEIDPSRIKAKQDIADNKLKQEVLDRKLSEQNNAKESNIDIFNPPNEKDSSSSSKPAMRIKIGEDEHGLNIYGPNPEFESWKKAEDLRQSELIKGPGADSGKVTLAQESLKNIDDIKSMLFPDGTSKSFNREAAFGSNPPALRLPLIGRVGANVRRDNPLDPTDNVKAQEAQDLFRKIGAALSARQLIQTGVAARPEETQKLIEQFAPNFFSNPDAALKGLDELKTFYSEYINKTDPETRFNKPNKTSKQSDPLGIR